MANIIACEELKLNRTFDGIACIKSASIQKKKDGNDYISGTADFNHDPDLEKLERSYKYAHFDSYTVSQIYDDLDTLEKYDWVEVTGTITKYQNNVIHISSNKSSDTFFVSGYPYDYTKGGRFDPDAFELGEEITLKGYVRYRPSNTSVEIGVFEIF